MAADDKLSEAFYDWLNECPVKWMREEVAEDAVSYWFYPEEEGSQ